VNGGSATDVEETKTYKSKTKFTVLYGKNFFDWTLRGGLIDNTGGVGVDYNMLNHKLKASVEAFDFEKLQLRASINYKLLYGIYLTGGYNDLLKNREAQSAYLGAGIFLTNDDLKLLLSKSPF
jgi:phospholipid/cholesterol/gamma-HCH transport system substrate-binding protein